MGLLGKRKQSVLPVHSTVSFADEERSSSDSGSPEEPEVEEEEGRRESSTMRKSLVFSFRSQKKSSPVKGGGGGSRRSLKSGGAGDTTTQGGESSVTSTPTKSTPNNKKNKNRRRATAHSFQPVPSFQPSSSARSIETAAQDSRSKSLPPRTIPTSPRSSKDVVQDSRTSKSLPPRTIPTRSPSALSLPTTKKALSQKQRRMDSLSEETEVETVNDTQSLPEELLPTQENTSSLPEEDIEAPPPTKPKRLSFKESLIETLLDIIFMSPIRLTLYIVTFLFVTSRSTLVLRLLPLLVIYEIFTIISKWFRFVVEGSGYALLRQSINVLKKRISNEVERTTEGGYYRRIQEGVYLRVNQYSANYWMNRIQRTSAALQRQDVENMDMTIRNLRRQVTMRRSK